MKTTTTNRKPTYQEPARVPGISTDATVQGQKALVSRYLCNLESRIHNEIDRRNGQGKPCPLEITEAILPGAQNLFVSMSRKNSGELRFYLMEILASALTEFTEYDYAQTPSQRTAA